MYSQLLIKPIDNKILFDFLDKYTQIHSKFYILTYDLFKSAKYNGDIKKFCDSIKDNYYKSLTLGRYLSLEYIFYKEGAHSASPSYIPKRPRFDILVRVQNYSH